AFRGEGQLIPGVFGGGAGPTGGSYSPADVAAVLARAASLGIEVLPEIEVPAHALALTRLIPGLRDPDDTGDEASVQGYRRNTMNPACPATWDLLVPLAQEVAALFPFRHLHLGGDEAPHDAWMGSQAARGWAGGAGATSDDIQGKMLSRLASTLAGAGIRPCAWEEAAKGVAGGIGNGAILFSWTGQGPGIEAARRGYDVVMTPAQHAYFDMAH